MKKINSKRKGLRRERQARKILEKEGYYCCPSKGSLGPFDISAIAKDPAIMPSPRVLAVSCDKIYGKERIKIEQYEIHAAKEIWVKQNYREWIRVRWQRDIGKWELL